MPIKNLIQRFQPAPLYIVLVLSICYFSLQLVLSHITHALTLLMASYHMLCNIFALTGCIVTIKHSKCKIASSSKITPAAIGKIVIETPSASISSMANEEQLKKVPPLFTVCVTEEQSLTKQQQRLEMKLRNTFGWTRIDILTMLIVCIILASLSFSLLVEALQTLVHIDHQDTMHLPIPVMILGLVGLILNALAYALIGGYTMHQGSFLQLMPNGDVVLNRSISNSAELTPINTDQHKLSKTRSVQEFTKEDLKEIGSVNYQMKRQSSVEILRDVSSTLFVIVCGFIVYMANDEEHTAKLIDPILSIFSCVFLVSLSYPYMKEACLILLQTIPGSIDIGNFERQLVAKFPEIISYHDLHIWQLSANKYVSTVHIKFQSPKLYAKIIEDIRAFFIEQGITIITIQPEFHSAKSAPSLECLVQCSTPECAEKVCCRDSRTDLREINVVCANDENCHSNDIVAHTKKHDHHYHNHNNHPNTDDHQHRTESANKTNHGHQNRCQNKKNDDNNDPASTIDCTSTKYDAKKEMKTTMLLKFKNVFLKTSYKESSNKENDAQAITATQSECDETDPTRELQEMSLKNRDGEPIKSRVSLTETKEQKQATPTTIAVISTTMVAPSSTTTTPTTSISSKTTPSETTTKTET